MSVLEGTCQLAVRDRQSPYLKLFQGAVWFVPLGDVTEAERIVDCLGQ